MQRVSGGEWRGRRLAEIGKAPIRPPLDKIKQAVFNILGPLEERMSALDLFAGSGSFGLEALSRGAGHATFVEKHPASRAVLAKNIEMLGAAPRCEVLAVSVFECRSRLGRAYDILLVDPPYALYDDAEECDRLALALDDLKRGGQLAAGFRGAVECPRGCGVRLKFSAVTVREIRPYGQTDVLILG